MKICFFAHASNLSGASASLINVTDRLKELGHKPFVVLPEHGDMETVLKEHNTDYIIQNSQSPLIPMNSRGFVRKIKHAVKRVINLSALTKLSKNKQIQSCDIIHVNGLYRTIGGEVALKLGIPFVWHIREFLEEDHYVEYYNKKREFGIISRADTVIGISNAIKNKFEPILNKNVRVIYNGVPSDKFFCDDNHAFRNDEIRIIIAGRISEPKRQLDAAKAVILLKNKGYNVKLIIVGSGMEPYLSELKQYLSEHDSNNCCEIKAHEHDMPRLLKACDIGLVCSACEAFGRVTVEYKMSGLLAVVSDTGGSVELVHDGEDGFVYKCADYNDLADKIEYAIINRDKMSDIISTGRDRAVNSFDISRNVDEIIDVYNSILSGGVAKN